MSGVKWTEVPVEKDDDVTWTEVDDSAIEKAGERPWYDLSAKGLARGAIDAIPVASAVGGGILGTGLGPAGSVGGAGLGYAAGSELSDFLKNRLLGDEATSVEPIEQLKRVSGNVASGASAEMGGQILGKGLGVAVDKAAKAKAYLAAKAGKAAEKLAVNATGATGAQSAKFADDAGRQLLDRKLVRFGDTAENVATRTGDAMNAATGNIDEALKSLDAKGVTANQDNVVGILKQKIDSLRGDASQLGVVRKLESIVDDIMETGRSKIPISAAEQTKRGFNKAAGNWMDPEAGAAGKQAYLGYMDEVERAAEAADPALAGMFKQGKETYGLLSPIEEAASKRAMTQNQSPLGGLGDWASVGAGGAAGGPVGALAGLIGKKQIAPRVTSSGAVALDKIAQSLMKSPRMQQMASQNPKAFQTMVSAIAQKAKSGTGGSAKVAGFDPTQPVSDEKAKQSFLEGN